MEKFKPQDKRLKEVACKLVEKYTYEEYVKHANERLQARYDQLANAVFGPVLKGGVK